MIEPISALIPGKETYAEYLTGQTDYTDARTGYQQKLMEWSDYQLVKPSPQLLKNEHAMETETQCSSPPSSK